MLNFCDFIQVYVFTTNHHLNKSKSSEKSSSRINERSLMAKVFNGDAFEFARLC